MRNSPPLLTELFPYLETGAPLPNGAELARMLMRIAEHEIEEGGPYAVKEETDVGLNFVIALFLRKLDVRLPNLDAYVDGALAKQAPASSFFDARELAELAARYRSDGTEPKENLASTAVDDGAAAAWTHEELVVLTAIRERMRWRFLTLPKEFRHAATRIIERTIKGNPDKQMSLMPLFMRQALGKQGTQFLDHELAELGLANVFFWTAFIIYDDFWDEDEAANPQDLPVANLFARHYTRFFSTHAPGIGLDSIFHKFMDKLDAANEWELMHCRLERRGNTVILPRALPEYRDFDIKFYPAAGHVVGPVSMLLELGYGADSPEVEGLIDYFRHYLIAMQLNDDAHDWKEDLARGHISTAVHILLGIWRIEHAERDSIDLELDMPELERLFWFKALPQLCEAILYRTEGAQQALDALSFIVDPAPLQRFIDRNREAARLALSEQQQSTAFLEAIQTGGDTQE